MNIYKNTENIGVNNEIIENLGFKRKVDQIINPENCELCLLKEFLWIERIINKQDLFIPYYQGIRNNKSGYIDKFEALIRYIDGNRIINPYMFIDIAKKNDLLLNISIIMINIVIKEMTLHNNDISLNLEGEISNNEVINLIFYNLELYKIDPKRLTIEVLETINFDKSTTQYENMLENIRLLKENGIKISLDDYGSGYSNILRVIDIKPDIVKIDGNLVKNLANNQDKGNIVEIATLIYMMHNSGKKVIAEHIESQFIQNILIDLKVDYSQGYFYSKPSREII